jgi:hypothetical protein
LNDRFEWPSEAEKRPEWPRKFLVLFLAALLLLALVIASAALMHHTSRRSVRLVLALWFGGFIAGLFLLRWWLRIVRFADRDDW